MADLRRKIVSASRRDQATLGRRQTLLQRAAGHCGELAQQPVGDLTGHRQLALALEALDRGRGLDADDAVRLELAIAEIGQPPLHPHDPAAPTPPPPSPPP